LAADGRAAAVPFTLAELDAKLSAIGGFERRPLIAVATSGGPDSLALAILADRWARGCDGRMSALIVDHRLRPESTAEAATVAAWLAARGIDRTILTWDGDKPAAGIQEVAREARYELLSEWCVARGCLHLLTAHHREDQAETYWIRRRAGSGVDGLAGMSAVRDLKGLRLVRPLLAVAKARLAATLNDEGQGYLSDPSNRDPTFERSRLRMEKGESTDAALVEVAMNAKVRIERERSVAALLARASSLHPAGFALLDAAPIIAAGELGVRALGRLAVTIGGARYPLRRDRLARLCTALSGTPARPRTLGGCRFVPWRGRWLVLRETARAAPPMPVGPGSTIVWDRRFTASLLPGAEPATLSYLGANGVTELRATGASRDTALPRLAHPALPAIRDAAGVVAVPHLDYRRSTGWILPTLRFCPASPLTGAGFQIVV
jgi:tRNA(Ile)-lysidine synthase